MARADKRENQLFLSAFQQKSKHFFYSFSLIFAAPAKKTCVQILSVELFMSRLPFMSLTALVLLLELFSVNTHCCLAGSANITEKLEKVF